MTTVTLLAWDVLVAEAPAAANIARELIERHQGRIGRRPGLAMFAGTADALDAAAALTRTFPTGVSAAIHVADQVSATDDDSTAALLTRRIARFAQDGEILATEVVRLLVPEPVQGRWVAPPDRLGLTDLLIHLFVVETDHTDAPTVVVAEDVAIIRGGIVSLLTAEGMHVVGQAADYETLLATVRATRPRLLITDVRMPPGQEDEGLRAAAMLRAEQPDLAVLVLSQHLLASAAAELLSGQTSGIGYLLKERVGALEDFIDAARTVAAGGTVIDPLITAELLERHRSGDGLKSLADRERSVLELMAQGLSNGAIAERLSVSDRTVESHIRSILTKLDIWDDPAGNRRVQAVIRWLDRQ